MNTTTTTPALPPRVGHVLRLAEIIQEVGGITPHGAAALAEGILEHPGFSGCHDGPAALPAQEPGGLGELAEFIDAIAADAVPSSTAARLRRVAEALRGIPALPAQEQGEGLVAELHRMASDAREAGWITDAECLTRTATLLQQQVAPPPLPPGYIDAEHQGEDRKLLEAFYGATNAEGGTADEIHLRGIRAVLALRPTVAAVRAADAAISAEALEAEFRAWWKAKVHPLNVPAYHTITTHLAWGRHLLSRGEL